MIKSFEEYIVNEAMISEANHDAEELNIMTAAVISVLKNSSYEEGPTFQKKLKSINYDDIINILNTQFGGNYTDNDIKRGTGKIMQVIQNNIDYITKNADEEMQEYYTNSVAGNAYNYDITNRDDIIRMVQELGTEKTLEILENARKEYELQRTQNEADRAAKQAETESRQQEQQVTSTNTNDNTVTKSTTVSTQKTTSASAQVSSIAKTDGLARAVASESFKSFKVREKEDFTLNCKSHMNKGSYVDVPGNYVLDINYNKAKKIEIKEKLIDILNR